jgi:hypothetical protein
MCWSNVPEGSQQYNNTDVMHKLFFEDLYIFAVMKTEGFIEIYGKL